MIPIPMKTLKQIVFALSLVMLFAGCRKPKACFTIDKASVPVNTPITCDGSCSKHAIRFYWLGAGIKHLSSQTQKVNTMMYTEPGTYSIKLEVTSGGLFEYKTDYTSKLVKVY